MLGWWRERLGQKWVSAPHSKVECQERNARAWPCSSTRPCPCPECGKHWAQICPCLCALHNTVCSHFLCSSLPLPSDPCWSGAQHHSPLPVLDSGTSQRHTPPHLRDRGRREMNIWAQRRNSAKKRLSTFLWSTASMKCCIGKSKNKCKSSFQCIQQFYFKRKSAQLLEYSKTETQSDRPLHACHLLCEESPQRP